MTQAPEIGGTVKDSPDAEFLMEVARFFRNRAASTSEDREFWANNQNAENLERIAAVIDRLSARVADLTWAAQRHSKQIIDLSEANAALQEKS